MPQPKFRAPDYAGFAPETEAARVARLAGAGDTPVYSPVHRLQSELAVFEQRERDADHYPGWFRVSFPIASSAVLWAAILWGAGLLG